MQSPLGPSFLIAYPGEVSSDRRGYPFFAPFPYKYLLSSSIIDSLPYSTPPRFWWILFFYLGVPATDGW